MSVQLDPMNRDGQAQGVYQPLRGVQHQQPAMGELHEDRLIMSGCEQMSVPLPNNLALAGQSGLVVASLPPVSTVQQAMSLNPNYAANAVGVRHQNPAPVQRALSHGVVAMMRHPSMQRVHEFEQDVAVRLAMGQVATEADERVNERSIGHRLPFLRSEASSARAGDTAHVHVPSVNGTAVVTNQRLLLASSGFRRHACTVQAPNQDPRSLPGGYVNVLDDVQEVSFFPIKIEEIVHVKYRSFDHSRVSHQVYAPAFTGAPAGIAAIFMVALVLAFAWEQSESTLLGVMAIGVALAGAFNLWRLTHVGKAPFFGFNKTCCPKKWVSTALHGTGPRVDPPEGYSLVSMRLSGEFSGLAALDLFLPREISRDAIAAFLREIQSARVSRSLEARRAQV